MNILIFIDDLLPGGTENVLASRLPRLNRDIRPHVATLYARGPLAESLEAKGIPVSFLDASPGNLVSTIRKAREMQRATRPDLTICMRSVSRGLLPFFLRGKTILFWDNPLISSSTRQSLAERFQINFARPNMYCCSQTTRQALLKAYGNQDITVIPNCYDENLFFPPEGTPAYDASSPLKIISIGNFRHAKNHPDKLRVASLLRDNKFNFKLEIIGQGDSSSMLKSISDMGLENFVTISSDSSSIPGKLRNSHIFLFTSHSEGFPVALLEAMACSLPCVTYKFPGIEEIDSSLSTLDIVEPPGDCNKLAQRIISIAANPSLANQLGHNAAKLVSDNFSASQNTLAWEKYLRNLAQHNPSR